MNYFTWKWFLDKSIGAQLGMGFGALVLLIIAFGLVVLSQMTELRRQSVIMYHHPYAVSNAVREVEIGILKVHREMKDLAHAVDPEEIQKHELQVSLHNEVLLRNLEIVSSQFLGDMEIVGNVKKLLLDWEPIRNQVIQLRFTGDFNGADAITRGVGARHVENINNELEKLKSFANGKAGDSLAESEMIVRESITFVSMVLVFAVLLAIVISIPITRSIRNPLTRLDQAAANVSRGDLTQQVKVESENELGRLASTFNSMIVSIRDKTAEIKQQSREIERLLLNILPAPIVNRLRKGEDTIADYFPEISVLFADIVGFTDLSKRTPPDELVEMLNDLFSLFDESASHMGIEKIKTVGDCYMAAAGLTVELDDPPGAMVEMALEMQSVIEQFNIQNGMGLQIRVGINCGPAVAGVIGRSKFIYDLWGDTVNIASRLESHGVPGRIQISEVIYERIKGRFRVESRGEIEIRGRGKLQCYLIDESDPRIETYLSQTFAN